jgi:hypothetical protein
VNKTCEFNISSVDLSYTKTKYLEIMKAITTQQERNLETIIERLYVIMKENPTMDENKAIELAFKQEQDFLAEMIEQRTERSKEALNQITKNVYGLSNIFN